MRKLTTQRAQELAQMRMKTTVDAPAARTAAENPFHPDNESAHAATTATSTQRSLSPDYADDDSVNDDVSFTYSYDSSLFGAQDPYDGLDEWWNTYWDDEKNEPREVVSGTKRGRGDSVGSDTPPMRKAMKAEGAEGRTKAAHYDAEVQEVLFTAIRYYRFYLSSRHPYPEALTEIAWAKSAWKDGCRVHEAAIAHDSEILGLVKASLLNHGWHLTRIGLQITARASHLRGEIKTKARDWVISLYDFQSSTKPTRIKKQQNRVEALISDFSYIYRVGRAFITPHRRLHVHSTELRRGRQCKIRFSEEPGHRSNHQRRLVQGKEGEGRCYCPERRIQSLPLACNRPCHNGGAHFILNGYLF
jgi:hypothetical protein